ncbi:hypothetical protein D3C72_2263540 [compost metagenome]
MLAAVADELRHLQGARMLVQITGLINLDDLPAEEDGYPSRQRHGLILVMGHINNGRVQLRMDAL